MFVYVQILIFFAISGGRTKLTNSGILKSYIKISSRHAYPFVNFSSHLRRPDKINQLLILNPHTNESHTTSWVTIGHISSIFFHICVSQILILFTISNGLTKLNNSEFLISILARKSQKFHFLSESQPTVIDLENSKKGIKRIISNIFPRLRIVYIFFGSLITSLLYLKETLLVSVYFVLMVKIKRALFCFCWRGRKQLIFCEHNECSARYK